MEKYGRRSGWMCWKGMGEDIGECTGEGLGEGMGEFTG